MIEVHDYAVEIVRPTRAMRATGIPIWTEHEVIDDQLTAAVEQLRQGLVSVRPLEYIILAHALPGQLAALLAQPIAHARELLLLDQELLARSDPFVVRYDLVLCHCDLLRPHGTPRTPNPSLILPELSKVRTQQGQC